jgi:hypothetical protein
VGQIKLPNWASSEYRNQVSLCSPTCTLVLSIAMLGNAAAQATPAEQVRVFRQVYASIDQ